MALRTIISAYRFYQRKHSVVPHISIDEAVNSHALPVVAGIVMPAPNQGRMNSTQEFINYLRTVRIVNPRKLMTQLEHMALMYECTSREGRQESDARQYVLGHRWMSKINRERKRRQNELS